MTKKTFISFAMLLIMGIATTFAQNGGNHLPLSIKPTTTGGGSTGFPKSLVQIPEVYLDGNTLSFDSAIEGCTVQLLDEDETVVYSSVISVGQTTLVLPSTLSGEYELQIVSGDITFYCDIKL